MLRWLALFLLVLIPLLSGWSVASAYGNDDAHAQSQHMGHHLNEHQNDADANAPDSAHADCDHCHSPGATPLNLADSARLPAPDLPSHWTDVALRAPPLSLPERPKWASFA